MTPAQSIANLADLSDVTQTPADGRHAARVAVVTLLVIPLILTIYTSRVVFVQLGARYLFDWISCEVCFLLLCLLALIPASLIVRSLCLLLVVCPVVLFHMACVLYFRFYNDRIPFDVIYQIADIPHLRTGIESLITLQDLIWIIAVPIMLISFVASRMPPVSARSLLPLGTLALLLLLGQHMLGGADDFSSHEPFTLFVSEGIEALEDYYSTDEKLEEIIAQRDVLYPLDGSKYTYAEPGKGVFLKIPVGQIQRPIRRADPPNIVLIVMESVRARESGTYGAGVSFTPSLDELSEHSLIATNFYANGFQTVRSEFALLTSNYPNLGRGPHYILNPSARLTTLPDILKHIGYSTLWISSYSADFHNKRQFLLSHGVQEIYDSQQCPTGRRIGWGPDDQTMLQWGIQILDRQQQPFFAEIMTLSNHFPFNGFPTDNNVPEIPEGSQYGGYTRGIYYTDYVIGEFIRQIRSKPWFDNTIFVITGDHGLFIFPDSEPRDLPHQLEAVFRVPLLIYSPRFVKPQTIDFVTSHVDLAPTILDLLGLQYPNTFLGHSFFQEITPEERYALMVQQNHWILRRRDQYFYGGEKQERRYWWQQPSDAYGGRIDWISGGLTVNQDLLFNTSRSAIPLPNDHVNHWSDWGRKVLLHNRLAIAKNWVLR